MRGGELVDTLDLGSSAAACGYEPNRHNSNSSGQEPIPCKHLRTIDALRAHVSVTQKKVTTKVRRFPKSTQKAGQMPGFRM